MTAGGFLRYRVKAEFINSFSSTCFQNKELLHKLRSMTETIKMLSMENETLREENDEFVKKAKAIGATDPKAIGKQGGKELGWSCGSCTSTVLMHWLSYHPGAVWWP